MFTCKKCNTEFNYKSHLERHMNRNTPCNMRDHIYRCDICNIELKHKSRIEAHNNSKKHINTYNENEKLKDTLKSEQKKKFIISHEELQNKKINEFENKNEELEDKIKKLENEIKRLKCNITNNITCKIDIDKKLIPMNNEITNISNLSKININTIIFHYKRFLNIIDLLFVINYYTNTYLNIFQDYIIHSDNFICLDDKQINLICNNKYFQIEFINIIKQKCIETVEYQILNNIIYIKFESLRFVCR